MGLLVTQLLFSSQISGVTCSRGLLKNGSLKGTVWSVSTVHMQDWMEQCLVLWLTDGIEQEVGNMSVKF